MVKRNGKVALQHYSTNPISIQVDGTEIVYSFVPKRNVCMAWVEERHVEKILSIMTKACDCNGGMKKPRFFPTSEINVSLWETGHLP